MTRLKRFLFLTHCHTFSSLIATIFEIKMFTWKYYYQETHTPLYGLLYTTLNHSDSDAILLFNNDCEYTLYRCDRVNRVGSVLVLFKLIT